MDPFGDLFSFIKKNDVNEDKGIQNNETKRQSISKRRNKKTDGEYACDKCEYTCVIKNVLRIHNEAVHLKVKNYECSACSHRSYSKLSVKAHVKSIHNDETCRIIKIGCSLCESKQSHEVCESKSKRLWKTNGKYGCDNCEYTTDQKEHMTIHIKAVHLKIKQFKCSMCDCARYRRQEIEAHIKSNHRNEQCRILIIGCPLCERKEKHECCVKQQRRMFNRKRPSKSYNQSAKFKCKECGYTSNLVKLITQHNEVVHMDIKKFFCRSCNYQSYYKQNMKTHIAKNHKSAWNKFGRLGCQSCENNDDGCNDCGFKEKSSNIKREIPTKKKKNKRKKPKTTKKDTSHEEAPTLKTTLFFCKDCGDSFDSIKRLEDHESDSHSDIARFSCNLCNYMSYFRLLLIEHQKHRHAGLASRVVKIGCKECEENIDGHECGIEIDVLQEEDLVKTVKNEVKKEVNLNHSETLTEKLNCLMCEFSSDDKGIILHTQRVHLGLMRYECVECGYRTFYRKSMKGHTKSRHRQENQNDTFLYLNCTLCIKEDDHEEHKYTKTIKVRKIKKKRRRKRNKEQKRTIKNESRTRRKRNGKLRTEGFNKCTEKNCGYASDFKQTLKAHVEKEHNGILKYKCNICDYKSYYRHLVAYHQQTSSHSDEKKILRIGCTFCEEDIFHTEHSNSGRKIRNRMEVIKGSLKCLEPACTYITDRKHTLTAHHYVSHTRKLNYLCNLCSFNSSSTGRVKIHQEAVHRGEEAKVVAIGCKRCEENIEHNRHTFPAKPFNYGHCLLCRDGVQHSEHEFTTVKSNMIQRRRSVKTEILFQEGEIHRERNTLECSICGIKLLNRKLQREHYQKEHPRNKIFNCKDCKYGTNFLPNLNTHASSKHEKKVRQCPLCFYNTTWNTSFLEHMRSAHGLFQKKTKHSVEMTAQPILCDDCGFSTFNQKQFNDHKLAACQSQPGILQYATNRKSHMHMGNNSSIKFKYEMSHSPAIGYKGNFKCNKCLFSSDKPAVIRDHVEKVHAGEFQIRRDDDKFKATNLTSNQDIKYKCNKCKFQTSEPTQLRDHLSSHD